MGGFVADCDGRRLCSKPAAPAGPAMQAFPVQTIAVQLAPVAQSSDYVSTIKSRRSATLQPRVDGNITAIAVHSGDHVRTGQMLMKIIPARRRPPWPRSWPPSARKGAL